VGLLRVSDFQEGVDGGYGIYTGQADIELRQGAPDTAFPTGGANGIFIDAVNTGATNARYALLRFDNIFGNNPGQIPTNAVVVSAELTLNIADSGDGSPLYRMMASWDGNTTWNSAGNGGLDHINSASFDSQLGLLDGSANSGLGLASVSVLPDVLAWQNGQSNYGWLMTGWSNNFDGTTFSTSETTNSAIRPRLKVLWLPAGTASASFRQGVNGYTNAFDTRIRETTPDLESSTSTGVFVDWSVAGTNDNEQALLRFDEIIGTGPGQIPPGSRIEAAMLDVASTINLAMGAGGKFHAMLQPWQDTNTWNSFGGGIQADGVKAAITPTTAAGTAERNPLVQGGFHSYELTADVQAWTSGTLTNYGWVVLPWPNGGDGWGFATAESSEERERPQLRVFYTPGTVSQSIVFQSISRTANSAVLHFSGGVGANSSVLRSATVSGPYSEIGTTTIGGDGTATFTDNAPLSYTAFYRIVSQ
jgi:hypothetical protein